MIKRCSLLIVHCSLLIALAACCRCEVEPIVERNQKLIVPPNFGQMPKE
jgi:hypothetical protein